MKRLVAVLFSAVALAGVLAPLASADSSQGCNGFNGVWTAYYGPGQGYHAYNEGAPRGCAD